MNNVTHQVRSCMQLMIKYTIECTCRVFVKSLIIDEENKKNYELKESEGLLICINVNIDFVLFYN